MIIQISGQSKELKFTFNSFKHMGEFDIKELQTIEQYPFKVIPIVTMLLMGALNSDRKTVFTVNQVEDFLEQYMEENSIMELLEELMNKLQESGFFKSLQKIDQA